MSAWPKSSWEDVESPEPGDYLERIKVPGGWLYRQVFRNTAMKENTAYAIAMVFVPESGDT